MILVDTSVWIDYFAGRALPHVNSLRMLLGSRESVLICGVVLMEVLQGMRQDADFKKTHACLDCLVFLPAARETHLHAAEIYRKLRSLGVTIRNPIDCLIAATAIENGVALLHHDRDFNSIERHCGLVVHHSK